ncbi:MAG: amidohydrolase family protein [Balneolaceae bacterium]
MLRTTLLMAVLMIFSSQIVSAQIQVPAERQQGPIAITNVEIHTVSNGVIENGTILFEDGVITAVGQNVTIPAGTRRIAMQGKQVYPGMIASQNQMGLYEIGAVDMTVDLNEQGNINPNIRPEVAVNPESRHIGTARSSGVLVAVSTPGGGLISGQSSAMNLDGWSWEQMLLESGVGLVINWPSPNNENNYTRTLRSAKEYFATARAYHRAVEAAENGNAPRPEADSKLEAMGPFLTGERPVLINANEVRQIQDAITWAVQEGLKPVIVGGRDAHLVAGQLVEHDVPVMITSVLTSPNRAWESYDNGYTLPARLHEAGVRIAITGGSSAPYAFRTRNEAGAAVAFGLSPLEAYKAVSLNPAQILGIDDRVGSIEPGKDATFIITDGFPLEYRTQIEQAFIQGREIDMMDVHKQFYEKYKQKIDTWESASN